MAKFVARLEATDGSGHFRRVVIFTGSVEEARSTLERRERAYTAFQLTGDELAKLEAKEQKATKEGLQLPPDDRQKLVFHRQPSPYEIVWIGETDPPRDKKRRKAA